MPVVLRFCVATERMADKEMVIKDPESPQSENDGNIISQGLEFLVWLIDICLF